MSDKIREAFERRYLESRGLPYPCDGSELHRNEESGYHFRDPADAWRAWQAALSQQPAPEVPEGYVLVAPEQLEKHTTTAWQCPPQSLVVLVSSLKRLHAKNAAAPAPAAQEPVAWQARFTDPGQEWSTCPKEHHALVQANPREWPGYETRELFAAPPAADQQPRMWMEKDESAVRELLAAINGDGGHHADCVGIAQASHDALAEFNRLRQTLAGQPAALGCNYQGSHFGASYPDAQCFDGYLWDEDSCAEPGGPLLHGGDIPCPKCNAEEYAKYLRDCGDGNDGDSAAEQPVAQEPITEDAAYQIGATGAEPIECERLLFEAWMRGHCWKVCGEWDGKTYVSASEDGKHVDHGAMLTRQLWAAWRDRAALAGKRAAEQPDTVPVPRELLVEHLDEVGEYAWETLDRMRALLGKESA